MPAQYSPARSRSILPLLWLVAAGPVARAQTPGGGPVESKAAAETQPATAVAPPASAASAPAAAADPTPAPSSASEAAEAAPSSGGSRFNARVRGSKVQGERAISDLQLTVGQLRSVPRRSP